MNSPENSPETKLEIPSGEGEPKVSESDAEKFGESLLKKALDAEKESGRTEQLDEARKLETLNDAHFEAQEKGKEEYIKATVLAAFGETRVRNRARGANSKEEFLATAAKEIRDAFTSLSIFSDKVKSASAEKDDVKDGDATADLHISRESGMILAAASHLGIYAVEKEGREAGGENDWRNGMQNWHEATDNARVSIEAEKEFPLFGEVKGIERSLEGNPKNAEGVYAGLGIIAERAEEVLSPIYDEEKKVQQSEKEAETKIMAFFDKYKDALPKDENEE